MNGLCDSYCKPCVYSRMDTHHNLIHCDYIGITGHSRGCPAGKGCVMRVEGEKKQSIPMMIFNGRRQDSDKSESDS